MNRRFGRFLFCCVCAAYLLSGCMVAFDHPLPVAEGLGPDERVYGLWFGVEDESESYLHVFGSGSGMLDLFLLYREQDRMQLLAFEGFSTWVDDSAVLCIRERSLEEQEDGPPEPRSWMIVPYVMDEGSLLTLYGLDVPVFREFVEAGELEGTVDEVLGGVSVHVTATSEALAAFFREKGIRSLIAEDPWMVFSRGANKGARTSR